MAQIMSLALRGLQFLWALLVMALTGNMIQESNGGSPSIINYSMFCAVFAMLCLIYLIASGVNESFVGHPIIPLALDALLTIFWLVGGIAMAAELDVHSCSNEGYLENNKVVGGSNKRCHEAQAVAAFLWFGFAAFLGSLIFSALATRGGGGVNLRGIRRGGPAMSQA